VTELSKELGLHKTTVVRLLNTLVVVGAARKEESTGRYCWDPRMWTTMVLKIRDLVVPAEMVEAVLGEVAERTGETALLVYPNAERRIAEVAACARSTSPIGVDIGRRECMPIHALAGGKAYLTGMSDGELSEWAERGLPAVTRHTITSFEELRRDVARARRRGYAISREECLVGTAGIGVPVRDGGGEVMAALELVMPVERMTREKISRVMPIVRGAAVQLGQLLYAAAAERTPGAGDGGTPEEKPGRPVPGSAQTTRRDTALKTRYRVV